jgi:hypothetical protein
MRYLILASGSHVGSLKAARAKNRGVALELYFLNLSHRGAQGLSRLDGTCIFLISLSPGHLLLGLNNLLLFF